MADRKGKLCDDCLSLCPVCTLDEVPPERTEDGEQSGAQTPLVPLDLHRMGGALPVPMPEPSELPEPRDSTWPVVLSTL